MTNRIQYELSGYPNKESCPEYRKGRGALKYLNQFYGWIPIIIQNNEIEKIIVGKKEQISLLIMSVFSGGHVLLDDLPGSGKTTLIKALSAAMGCSFGRIQFTPDLLPSDILGMTVFNQKNR